MVLYGFGNVRVNCNVFGGCRTILEYYDDTVQIEVIVVIVGAIC